MPFNSMGAAAMHYETTNQPEQIVKELPFEGFEEQIKKPLEQEDPKSLGSIKRLFLESASSQNNPFSYLIQRLSGKAFNEYKAQEHWSNILNHKKDMEAKLGRIIGVQTAAVDYFSIVSEMEYCTFIKKNFHDLEAVRNEKDREEWIDRIYTPTYYIEKLKEELSRARRYNHALSAIMLDVDGLHNINQRFSHEFGDKILALIIKIIKKIIRTVDIIARYSGDRFLIILPNTNKREAIELADRIRARVHGRTAILPELDSGITLTLSVGQSERDEKSLEFIKRLENLLQSGKNKQRNAVYSL